ncbi:kinesin light chain [Xylariaceae sp. FL1019]|nr:kinesin light chain [Xylariaceae sp. FL1019]
MRLLTRNLSGSFDLTEYPAGSTIPRYAILSHRWGPDEVTYSDIQRGSGQRKHGYDKIRFCGEQAERDGLQHFWVDTCCIDKSSSAELTESINSMFHWYSTATRCYAYLQDVSCIANPGTVEQNEEAWHVSFQSSSWFTRGWTLQELIAPSTVEFFSKEGQKLGSKESLEHRICTVTGIPSGALRGSPLSSFSVAERMTWAERREATRPEDLAYSLLGIFSIHMPLLYGEGKEKAMNRLREEITKDQKGNRHEDFSVPFSLYTVPEIEEFVARERELAEMHERLKTDGRRRVVVLHGLGGMGKTQLAIAYTKRHKDGYSAIFWLNIKDENSLKQSFSRIAQRIKRQHPSARYISGLDIQSDLDETVEAVKAWLSLSNNSRWLLVYDNYDNPQLPDPSAIDVRKYLPESYQGAIIITTRSSQVEIGHAMRMSKLQNLDDSLEILMKTSKRENLADDPEAENLAKELDGLPLALATAGAYLKQTAISLQSYLHLYRNSWAKLQTSSPELASYEDRTLYSTWQLSYDQIKQRSEHSAALLRLWAYFDSQDLWLELLQNSYPNRPQWVQEVTEDDISFNNAVRTLIDYGLVEVDSSTNESSESRGYSIHACVHAWTIHVLNKERDIQLKEFAIICVASHIPNYYSSKYWLTQRRLLQHAARIDTIDIDNMGVDDEATLQSIRNLGNVYHRQGKEKEGEKMYERALRRQEKVLGLDHPATLNTVGEIGLLYNQQWKLKKAEKMLERALRGKLKTFGPHDPVTLRTIHHLGDLYSNQGKFEKAEQMYKQALQGNEKALGPEHPATLDTGNLKEAEEMYKRAVQGFQVIYGSTYWRVERLLGVLQEMSIPPDSSINKARPDSHDWRRLRFGSRIKELLRTKRN